MLPIGASAPPEIQAAIKEPCGEDFQEPDNTRYAGGKVGYARCAHQPALAGRWVRTFRSSFPDLGWPVSTVPPWPMVGPMLSGFWPNPVITSVEPIPI